MNSKTIRDFIEQRQSNIYNNYDSIAYAFENHYDWPEVDPVRYEICECIICGFYQAAITLTNHLLESVLKKALIIDTSVKNKTDQNNIANVFDDASAHFAKENLYNNIEQAYKVGLITDAEKNTLHNCRESYRNAFSHADPQKTFSGISIPAKIFTTKDLDNPEDFFKRVFADKPNTSLSAENNIIVQGIAQCIKAEQQATQYFLTIDGVIRSIYSNLFDDKRNKIQKP